MYAQMIEWLISEREMTEASIAKKVKCSQPTVHRIRKGHPNFSVMVGDALRHLYSSMQGHPNRRHDDPKSDHPRRRRDDAPGKGAS